MMKDYIGIPFVSGGRDHLGCDCYGLVRLILFEQAGIELPSYDLVSAHDSLRVMRAMQRERAVRIWVPVEKPRRLDVVLMAHCTRPEIHVHVGIMISDEVMLHCEASAGTHATTLSEPLVAARVRGVFRHYRLANDGGLAHAA